MDGGASVAARCRISRFTIGNCVASPGNVLTAEPSFASEISVLRESRRYYDCRLLKRALSQSVKVKIPRSQTEQRQTGARSGCLSTGRPSLVVSLLEEAHPRICQTSAASPAEPGDLPTD